MKINDALKLVENSTEEELSRITRDEFMFIVAGMSPEDIQTFMFAKNIKVYGGINGYVDNFFAKGTVEQLKLLPLIHRAGGIATLKKMLTTPGISEPNKLRIDNALEQLSINPNAPARAARKRKTRKSRRSRSRRN